MIIGAGAAGMMSAIECGKRGRKTLLIDHSKKIGEKIRISGGGRCNFTNLNASPIKYISKNPSFIISALNQYNQEDFIDLVKKYKIKYHEKKLGQLFCDNSAQEIIDMLLNECKLANVVLKVDTKVIEVSYKDKIFITQDNSKTYLSSSLIVATGGLSVPKIGASKFGYDLAKQFNLNVIDTVPALVPLTFNEKILNKCKLLAGVSANAIISIKKTLFEEGMLFTHRGLSGPSILQISSYWKEGESLNIDLCPEKNIFNFLLNKRNTSPKQSINSIISSFLAKRLATIICEENKITGNI